MCTTRLLISGLAVSLRPGGFAACKRSPAEPVSAQPTTTNLAGASNAVEVGSSFSSASLPNQRIMTCAGKANANFRQYPTLDPAAILGVVASGDFVQLTGRVAKAEGVMWVEAIAPALYPNLDAKAKDQLEPNQTGWIASCFFNR